MSKLFTRAAVSSATLTGANLKATLTALWDALNTGGFTDSSRATVSTTSTLTTTQCGLLLIDATAGSIVLTLPASGAAADDAVFKLRRIDGTANTVTVQRAGADTINGAVNIVLPALGNAEIQLPAGSVNWRSFGTAAAGTNSDITSLSALVSVNTGQIAGRRNQIINGNGLVQQRTAPTLAAALQYGSADRHMVGVTAGTGVSGTAGILSRAEFSAGVGYGAIAASWTTGQFIFKHRIESVNAKQFAGKTVTVSGKIYQDTGSSRSFTVSLGKPTTTADTFSAVTNLGTSGAAAVATGTVTSFSYTLALGATDPLLGLEVLITDTAANTVATKNYVISDLQFEIGTAASAFEQQDYGDELRRCKRYLPSRYGGGGIGAGYVSNTATNANVAIAFDVDARTAPTGILTSSDAHFSQFSAGGGGVCSTIVFTSAGISGAVVTATAAAGSIGFGAYMQGNTASAKMFFTGCEL